MVRVARLAHAVAGAEVAVVVVVAAERMAMQVPPAQQVPKVAVHRRLAVEVVEVVEIVEVAAAAVRAVAQLRHPMAEGVATAVGAVVVLMAAMVTLEVSALVATYPPAKAT